MKVKELIEVLQSLPQDHNVILSADAEGNNYHHLTEVSQEEAYDPDAYVPEFVDPIVDDDTSRSNTVVLWP